MSFLFSIFFFAVACVAAYEAYRWLRSASVGSQPSPSTSINGPMADSALLRGALWGVIALGSALAAFYFDFLAAMYFQWLD
jgi:hypothetical protein